jgi:uncharacterized protein (UPF0305 family)
MCKIYTWRKARHIHKRQTHLFVKRMLHKDFYRKGSIEKKKISDRESEGSWRQDELIGGKPAVVK